MIRAGTSIMDITPPLGTPIPGLFHERWAETVNDPLHVRSFVLEREGTGIAVAVCDLIGVKRQYLDAAKKKISDAIPLDPSHVLICCTHTHTGAQTGDDTYTEFVINRIADSVRIAWENLEPVQVGWGRGREDRVIFNRRYRMKDGSFRTNPGIRNPDVVEPAGPVDPEVGVLCMRNTTESTVGLLANYTLHYVGGGDHQRAVSADYFGMFCEFIQRLRGERFVAALSNGASGDINNIDVLGGTRHKNDKYQHTERVAAVIASAAFWTWNEMTFTDDVLLGAKMEEVVLKRRPLHSNQELARVREIEQRDKKTMGERAFVRRIKRIAELPEEIHTWVQALRIGELALVGVPGEYFVELGLDIKKRSPFAQTMILELANDSIGYIPTRLAFEEGGYEPQACYFVPGVGEQIAETALKLLDQLRV